MDTMIKIKNMAAMVVADIRRLRPRQDMGRRRNMLKPLK